VQLIAARRILDAWDRVGDVSPARRPAALVASLVEEKSEDDLLELPVGACDALLLQVHELLFGTAMRAICACPVCGEEFEFSASTHELLGTSVAQTPAGFREITVDGYSITYRLPTGRDVAGAGECGDIESARRHLLKSCITQASTQALPSVDPLTLPESVVNKLGEEMTKDDAHAELSFAFRCSACGRDWDEVLDVAGFLWSKIQAFAGRLLEEVHVLAVHYGWSESAILDMSARRRHAYLQMVEA
jgi:hypothetical protein